MDITKVGFNSLSVEEQINFFNKHLYMGKTISRICENINISYNTIRDRFKRHNFIYNKYIKQYECIKTNFDNNYDESVLEKALERVLNKLNQDEKRESEQLNCDIKGKVVNRSFRIYDEVLDDFTSFCKNSNYNQYDILSKFIKEGMEKYKN